MRHHRSKKDSGVSLPAALGLALIAILLATVAADWSLTRHYEALFYSAKAEQTQRLLDTEIAARVWREQFALARNTGRGIASDKQLARAIAAGETVAVAQLLEDEFHRGAVSSGQLPLEGITVYDAQFRPVAERWASEPAVVPAEVIAAAAGRTGIGRLSAMQIAWLRNGEPRLTVFVAMGLRPDGYIGLHIDPLAALGPLDERIGMVVRISSRTDGRLLSAPNNVHFPPDAITRDSTLRLHGPGGEYLADILATEDVSALSRGLGQTRRDWTVIGIALVGGVAAISGVFVHFFLRQVRRREQQDEARFRDYAETASDWFWETGPDHRWTYMSDRARAFGVDPKKRIGVSRIAVAGDAEDEPEKWQAHIAALDRHEPFRDFVYRRKLDDGPRYVSVSGKPVFDENGSFSGYRGTARDVTARFLREQQLREAKAEAEGLRDEALAADRAKSEFLATMSHELRTPLNAIIGFSETMLHEVLGPIGNPRYREYAGDIHASGEHLLELINSILDLSKIQARSMSLHEETVDVAALVGSCMRLIGERARNTGVELASDVPEELLLRADELRLKQIVLNLLSNALKFTPSGGSVTVSAARLEDEHTKIIVADSGIGLSPEEIRIALQPFRQVDSSLARKHQGTGLGLPLSKALVELHGGELVIESAPGQGTTISILMPAERSLDPTPAERFFMAG